MGKYTKSNMPLSCSFSCATSISRVYLLGMFRSITVVPAPLHIELEEPLSPLEVCNWQAPPKLLGLPSGCDQLPASSPALGAAASPALHAPSSAAGGSCTCGSCAATAMASSSPPACSVSDGTAASNPAASGRPSPPSPSSCRKLVSIPLVPSKSIVPQPQGTYMSVLASYIIGGTPGKGMPMVSKPIISYGTMPSPSKAGGSSIPHTPS
mmetsp:Transcript_110587/g.345779  ORF Transcript_110587/g.345779 Transcript_110587/m.345779 type:complete len:210 (+) Transcript_110587:579-1208(+)